VFGDLEYGEFDLICGHEIHPGQGNEGVSDPDEVEDGEVLLRLGHPPLVGGDHEQSGVDPATREHVLRSARGGRRRILPSSAEFGRAKPRSMVKRVAPPPIDRDHGR
jgi:hypothetical protein